MPLPLLLLLLLLLLSFGLDDHPRVTSFNWLCGPVQEHTVTGQGRK